MSLDAHVRPILAPASSVCSPGGCRGAAGGPVGLSDDGSRTVAPVGESPSTTARERGLPGPSFLYSSFCGPFLWCEAWLRSVSVTLQRRRPPRLCAKVPRTLWYGTLRAP